MVGVPLAANGHGDVHSEIDRITEQLTTASQDGALYLRRAKLHATHGEWAEADADFAEASRCSPDLQGIDLARGEALCRAGNVDAALSVLGRHIERVPGDWAGYVARGRALMAAGRAADAVQDFQRATELKRDADPELCFEYAQSLISAERWERALGVLDTGIERFGPLVTLVTPAIECEVKLERYDAALARLDRFLVNLPRKERWLARRGQILERAGRPDEAEQSYREARRAIDTLPVERRVVAAVRDLQWELNAGMERIASRANGEERK